MPKPPWMLVATTSALMAACGGSAPPEAEAPPPPSTPPPSSTPSVDDVSERYHADPVEGAMTKEGVKAICDRHLGHAAALLAEVKALGPVQTLSYDAVLGRVDRISLELSLAGGMPSLMAEGHPDESVREAAKLCRPKLSEFYTNLMLDADFAAVIKRYAQSQPNLSGTRKRMLDELLRDFRRNGLELPAEGQAELRKLNDELTRLEQDFGNNLAEAELSIRVDKKKLAGLPDSFLEAHPADDDGKVTLTTNYPDYFPVVTYAEDRSIARALHEKFDSRAADKNVKILERVLMLRRQKAELLGYETWAAYAIEPRMAKTPEAVQAFLDKAKKLVAEPAKAEYAEYLALHRKKGGKAKRIPIYDRLYYEQKLREKKYGFDSKKLSEYFEVTEVLEGLLSIVSRLYGVKFQANEEAPRWHEEVIALDVMQGDEKRGRVYLDLYPREGKFKHAAMFEIRTGAKLPDGSYLPPLSALMCNFPKPGKAAALLTHTQVTTFFHEFGHALHHVLTEEELATYSGTNTVRDFVEAPSQMFEEWTWQRDTLDQFAKHHETGEKIPDELFSAMTRSRSFGRALSTERQISLATLDFQYHQRKPPFSTDEVFDQIMSETQSFAYLPDTHFQATFGHLMGYDAGYYGYQWALAIAQDVLTRFFEEGFLNPKVAADWRHAVLARGAGSDERELVRAFLGRETNLDAYGDYLAGK